MSFFYHILGAIAELNQQLGATRRPGFSGSLIAMLILLGAIGFCGFQAQVARQEQHLNAGPPPEVALSDVIDNQYPYGKVIKASGYLNQDIRIERYRTRRGVKVGVSRVYMPLESELTGKMLFVEFAGRPMTTDPDEKTLVTGILRPLDGSVKSKLSQADPELRSLIDPDKMLVVGENPASPQPFIVGILVAAVLLGLMLAATFLQNTIFQPTPDVVLSPSPPLPGTDPPGNALANGVFFLDAQRKKFFPYAPISLVRLKNGVPALIGANETPVGLMDQDTLHHMEERTGYWAIVLGRLFADDIEAGIHYQGYAARPALRIRYIEEFSGQPADTVVAFMDEIDRAEAYRHLLNAPEIAEEPEETPTISMGPDAAARAAYASLTGGRPNPSPLTPPPPPAPTKPETRQSTDVMPF